MLFFLFSVFCLAVLLVLIVVLSFSDVLLFSRLVFQLSVVSCSVDQLLKCSLLDFFNFANLDCQF